MPFDPFGLLAETAGKVVADAWTAMMLGLWNAGLWLLRVVLQFEDHFLTPDVTEQGPARDVYATTFWIAAALVLVMVMIQLGTALLVRDGKSLGRVAWGTGQFVMVWVAWIGYGAAVITACAGLNRVLMQTLFAVDSLDAWQPWTPFTGEDIHEGVVATVLGLMGLLLWLAAIAHFIVILTRAGALLVLAATTPVSAAGLVSDTGRSWFWKSLRWFHAAAFTPLVMTLIMGIGVRLSTGVALGMAGSAQSAIGTALPSVVMIMVSAVAPLALFKLLAFVDPGTNSGASVRAGMAAVGGVSGLLGGGSAGGVGSGTAAESDSAGRSRGEAQGEAVTSQRFAGAEAGMAEGLGPVGQAVGAGLRVFVAAGGTAAAVATDTTNQMGAGHNTYQPDFSDRTRSGRGSSGGQQGHDQAGADDPDQPMDDNTGGMPPPWNPYDLDNGPGRPTPDTPPSHGSPGGPGGGRAAGGGPGGSAGGRAAGGQAGGAEAASVVV